MYGIRVRYRGDEISILEVSEGGSLAFQIGPAVPKSNWNIRIPATGQSPPKEKEEITNIETGITYVITRVRIAPAGSATIKHHYVETQRK